MIHYAGGDEELYHTGDDRYEWNNLAAKAEHRDRIAKLRALAPSSFARKIPPSDESLTKLFWHRATDKATPPSKPDGDPFQVVFINRSKQTVRLWWISRTGTPKLYAEIEAGRRKRQQTRPGAVWMITDEKEKPLGHFIVGDRTARAVIPANAGKED